MKNSNRLPDGPGLFVPPPKPSIRTIRRDLKRIDARDRRAAIRGETTVWPVEPVTTATTAMVAGRAVCHINRPRTWLGGDFTEIDGFVERLRALGARADITTEVPSSPAYPLYHLWNLGRPWTADAARILNAKDRPYVISSIYFPGEIPAPGTEETLAGAAAVLVYSEREQEALETDFPFLRAQDKCHTVQKGIDALFRPKPRGRRDVDVVIVGSIDRRKNVLGALRACHRLGVVPVIAGPIRDPAYWEECQAFRFDHRGVLDRPALAALCQRSRVILHPAWFDPAPNAVLEAAAAGCGVVLTRRTYLMHLPDVQWCDPYDQASVEQALRTALRMRAVGELQQFVVDAFDWSAQVGLLTRVYDLSAPQAWSAV